MLDADHLQKMQNSSESHSERDRAEQAIKLLTVPRNDDELDSLLPPVPPLPPYPLLPAHPPSIGVLPVPAVPAPPNLPAPPPVSFLHVCSFNETVSVFCCVDHTAYSTGGDYCHCTASSCSYGSVGEFFILVVCILWVSCLTVQENVKGVSNKPFEELASYSSPHPLVVMALEPVIVRCRGVRWLIRLLLQLMLHGVVADAKTVLAWPGKYETDSY